jgi:hypothetical protein
VHWASGVKSLTTGLRSSASSPLSHGGALCAAVSEELFRECFGDECHWSVPCVSGPNRSGHNHPDREGPLKESNVSHRLTRATPMDSSNGRDNRFGLARLVHEREWEEWRSVTQSCFLKRDLDHRRLAKGQANWRYLPMNNGMSSPTPLKRKFSMGIIMKTVSAFAFAILAGCANPYADFYHSTIDTKTLKSYVPSSAPLVIYTTNDFRKDTDALILRSFAPIGNSSFNAGSNAASERQLRSQAEAVHAQVVLISSHYTHMVTGAVPLVLPQTSTTYVSGSFGTATATTYGTETTMMPYSVQRSDFGAVYFVKVRQRVGIIAAPLDEVTRKRIDTNSGVSVRLVVEGSPAFVADIFPGDILLSINSDRVQSTEQYVQLLNQHEGQTATLHLNRDGHAIDKTIRIASYQDPM